MLTQNSHWKSRSVLTTPFLIRFRQRTRLYVELQNEAMGNSSTSIESWFWPPYSWSVYREMVCTNNDVEGWHNRLNSKSSRGKLDICQLAPLRHKEAEIVSINVHLLLEDKLRRRQ